jgi:hypothetical protein
METRTIKYKQAKSTADRRQPDAVVGWIFSAFMNAAGTRCNRGRYDSVMIARLCHVSAVLSGPFLELDMGKLGGERHQRHHLSLSLSLSLGQDCPVHFFPLR